VNIAYLINQYPQASQSFIRREIRALEAHGVTVHRFTIRTWDQELVDPGDKEEKAKTRVVLDAGAINLILATLKVLFSRPIAFFKTFRLASGLGRRGDRGRLYHLIYLAEACVLLGWLKQCGAQHVHAHFGTNSTSVAMLVRSLGGPTYSFTCHGPEEFDRPTALKLGEKIAASQFAVAVSQYGRSQMMRWCPHEHWHKLHVVHCGVDASFLQSENLPEVPENHRLVCVGRLAEQKGPLLLIDAAARLKRDGIPFELLLIGDGPLRADLEQLIARHRLSDQVRIAGWMTNQHVRDHILASRGFILPSFAEGLPVVLMEAMALRRPVVSTYVAGIPELVEDRVNGYLVAAGSTDALADAMTRLLTEPIDRLRAMGREGARRVARQHDAATEAATLARLFAAAVQRQPGPVNTVGSATLNEVADGKMGGM
jgi:glycosyltransferase involved in cell wall biosynthesis